MAFQLADLFVNFTTAGVEKVKAGIDSVKQGISAATAEISKLGILGSISLGGLVSAGIAMSGTGQILAYQMERLARTVAGLFAPEIDKAIELIGRLADWLNNLSDAKRAMIAQVVMGAVAFGAMNRLIPALVSGIYTVVAGVKALAVAVTVGLGSTGIGALLPLIGYAIAGLTAFFAATDTGRGIFMRLWEAFEPFREVVANVVTQLGDMLAPVFDDLTSLLNKTAELLAPVAELFAWLAGVLIESLVPAMRIVVGILQFQINLWRQLIEAIKAVAEFFGAKFPKLDTTPVKSGSRKELMPRTGGFESIESTWQRIAQATLKVGAASTPELDELREIKAATKGTKEAVEKIKPVMK